jgi:hypothetical protein
MPLAPVSEEPMASTIIRFGNSSRKRSLSTGEKTTAVEASTNSELRSSASGPPRSSRASSSGRAMASPVIETLLIASRSMVRQASWGSNRRCITERFPSKAKRKNPHWAAPCMRGGRLSERIGASLASALRARVHSSSTGSLV